MIVSTLGVIASIPGQTMGVGVFTDHLIASLKLSRTELSTAYMIGTLGSSFLLPFAGDLVDRFGARVSVVWAAIGLGLSLVFLSKTPLTLAIDISYLPVSIIFIAATFCFLFMRFFGQGCLTMISRVLIGKWFNHKRGLATGISGVFVAFGFNASPMFLNHIVSALDWQNACLLLALLVGGGMTLLGWLFYRDNPEACGLIMDGAKDQDTYDKIASKIPETRREYTRRQALRTYEFWVFSIAIGTVGLIITAATFHIASIGSEMGLSKETAYSLFMPMAFFSIAANFLSGWISDRVRHRWLIMAMMIAQLLAVLGLTMLDTAFGRWLFFGGQGSAAGMFVALSTVVLPRFFGRTHLGSISGANFSIMVFASAMGPVLFSLGQDLTGSYKEIILIFGLLPFLLAAAALKVRNPQDRNLFRPDRKPE